MAYSTVKINNETGEVTPARTGYDGTGRKRKYTYVDVKNIYSFEVGRPACFALEVAIKKGLFDPAGDVFEFDSKSRCGTGDAR